MLIPDKHSGYIAGARLYPGGKGGSTVTTPPPDPRLIDAQIKSLGVQDSAIQAILANTAELAPLQKAQLEFGLTTAKTAYDQSLEDRSYALDKRAQYDAALAPLAEEAANFDETARGEELYGKAVADISQQVASAKDQTRRALERTGANPSDGMMADMESNADLDAALGKALAGSKAREAATIEGRGLKTNLVNMLAGFPAQAAGLSVNGANLGASGLGMTNSALTGINSGYSTATGAAGSMGSNATGMYTTQNNAFTSANNASSAADAGSSAAIGSAVGGIAIAI